VSIIYLGIRQRSQTAAFFLPEVPPSTAGFLIKLYCLYHFFDYFQCINVKIIVFFKVKQSKKTKYFKIEYLKDILPFLGVNIALFVLSQKLYAWLCHKNQLSYAKIARKITRFFRKM
jgi:hypothetical protein